MGKVAAESFLKMTITAPPNQAIKFTSKFESWLQLGFCKGKMKTHSFVRKDILSNSVESMKDLKENSLESGNFKEKGVSSWMKQLEQKWNI